MACVDVASTPMLHPVHHNFIVIISYTLHECSSHLLHTLHISSPPIPTPTLTPQPQPSHPPNTPQQLPRRLPRPGQRQRRPHANRNTQPRHHHLILGRLILIHLIHILIRNPHPRILPRKLRQAKQPLHHRLAQAVARWFPYRDDDLPQPCGSRLAARVEEGGERGGGDGHKGGGWETAVDAILDAREGVGVVFREVEAQGVVVYFEAGGFGVELLADVFELVEFMVWVLGVFEYGFVVARVVVRVVLEGVCWGCERIGDNLVA